MDFKFTFYLDELKKKVDVVEKELHAAAAKCKKEHGVTNVALSCVVPNEG